MTSRPASDFGKRRSRTRNVARSVPSAPIAWDGRRLRRQCGRRLQGRQGPHVRARRQDRQDRLGVLSGSQSRGRRDPRTARHERRSTRRPGKTRPAYRSAVAGPGRHTRSIPKTGQLYVPGGNPAPDFAIAAREGENLYTDSVVVLDAKTGDYKHHFKIVPKDWHDWDVSNPPVLIQTMGGKQLMVGRAQGWTPLRLRSRQQQRGSTRVPVTQVEDVAATFAPGKAVHFCPGAVGAPNGTARPTFRRRTLSSSARSSGATRSTPKDVNELRSVKVGQPWAGMATWNPFWMFGRRAPRTDTGPGGSTPSTPTPASGSGA